MRAPPDRLAELMRFEAARAREWFDRGLGLVGLLEPRSASCLLAMTGIYREILRRIEAHPVSVLRERVSLSVWDKAWVATRSLTGAHGARRSALAAGGPGGGR